MFWGAVGLGVNLLLHTADDALMGVAYLFEGEGGVGVAAHKPAVIAGGSQLSDMVFLLVYAARCHAG